MSSDMKAWRKYAWRVEISIWRARGSGTKLGRIISKRRRRRNDRIGLVVVITIFKSLVLIEGRRLLPVVVAARVEALVVLGRCLLVDVDVDIHVALLLATPPSVRRRPSSWKPPLSAYSVPRSSRRSRSRTACIRSIATWRVPSHSCS